MPVKTGVDLVWIPLPSIVAKAYFATAERAADMLDPMYDAVEVVQGQIEANFDVEGRPAKWAPLSEATIGLRQEAGFPGEHPILVRTGALKDAVTSASAWDIEASGQTVSALMTDPTGYGSYHISGTIYMPIRDWSYVDDEALDEIEQLFMEWVTQDFE